MIPLRTPVSILGSEEERAIRENQTKAQQIDLLKISHNEAQRLLFEGNYELAIPAALQALRFSIEIYGKDSIKLVPAYLLLGEADIGLKHYKGNIIANNTRGGKLFISGQMGHLVLDNAFNSLENVMDAKTL